MTNKLRLKPWVEYLSIKDKDAHIARLHLADDFAWAQRIFVAETERQYNAGKPVRLIVLKGRQIGISTMSAAVLFTWCFLFPGSNSLVLSKSREDSETLFEMPKLMWETWPFAKLFSTTRKSTRRLSWGETLSNYQVATAKGEQVGRGRTLQAVHCSEVAFWEDADGIMQSMGPAMPYKHGTIVILESTANGVGGFFYDEWQKACRGESDYTPLFFPWWRHSEYQIRKHQMRTADLTSNELELQAEVQRVSGYELTLAQLAWRRRVIRTDGRGDEDWFRAEYPSWPDEAFLATGRNVFPLQALVECYYPPDGERVGVSRGHLRNDRGRLTLFRDNAGPLLVFKTPDKAKKAKYVIGLDAARTVEGDPACIQVLNRTTLEQVAVYHGWATHADLAEIMVNLGYWYNEAVLNVEIEGGGAGVIAVIQHLRYPHIWRWRLPDRPLHRLGNVFGWSTNSRTKPWMIESIQNYLHKRAIVIHDPQTYAEMREYIHIDGYEMGPADPSGHDDAVMAYGVALMTTITEDPVNMAEMFGVGEYARGYTQPEPYQPYELAGGFHDLSEQYEEI